MQLFELIGNRQLLKILQLFLDHPLHQFAVQEVIKQTKVTKGTAIKWTRFLEKRGLLEVERIGVTKLLSLREVHPLVPQLMKINASAKLAELRSYKDVELYLIGPYLTGLAGDDKEEDKGESKGSRTKTHGSSIAVQKLQLLILGKSDDPALREMLAHIEKKHAIEIEPFFFSYQEWKELAQAQHQFYMQAEKEKIRLNEKESVED